MTQDGTDRLRNDALAQLFQLASEASLGADQEAELRGDSGRAFHDSASRPLPMAADALDMLPVLFGKLREALLPCGGRPMGDLVLDAGTDVAALRRIKDHAKHLSRQPQSKTARNAAVALYYAAIASALVYHGQRISSYGQAELAHSFESLEGKSWLPETFRGLFGRAVRLCRSHGDTSAEGGTP